MRTLKTSNLSVFPFFLPPLVILLANYLLLVSLLLHTVYRRRKYRHVGHLLHDFYTTSAFPLFSRVVLIPQGCPDQTSSKRTWKMGFSGPWENRVNRQAVTSRSYSHTTNTSADRESLRRGFVFPEPNPVKNKSLPFPQIHQISPSVTRSLCLEGFKGVTKRKKD